MASYGQFCPLAKAMEILDERWTMLVVRELLAGSTHFNELRRGNPRMSPALLSKRLTRLERSGVVGRRAEGTHVSYILTASGEELRPAVEALAAWGIRWIGELGEADLDPHLLLWDMHRTLPLREWPRRRTVVAFEFDDVPRATARWWLCVSGNQVDVCDVDPGFDVDLTVRTGLRTMVELWRGDRSWQQALREELITLTGTTELARRLPDLLGRMATAAVPRPG
ncbi:helix-turn-helix domain-containing protein [uncultured Arthrobacter sp.]|uniref:winged helix-turn-helix transcriptional regulator n=1 Tax=uncultured Arthrobacter sp. TaxID=114050 RepID=UPI0026191CB1|nr:helix-turn-helix domain-containing protein [uncultured Arthrobacter sp.]